MWRVLFETGEALHVEARSADEASIRARFLAWSVTGHWLTVQEVSRG